MKDADDSGTSEEHSDSDDSDQNRPRPEPWKDEDLLRELYHEEGKSQYQIADRFELTQPTISYWMDEFDIETRPPMHEREGKGIYRCSRDDGRVQYFVHNEGGSGADGIATFYESNLVALLSDSLFDVSDDESDVHHRLNSPIKLNVPANLRTWDGGEHQRRHADGTAAIHPELVLGEMLEEGSPLKENWRERLMLRRRYGRTAGGV